ncbi:MAG: TIGR04086 family membrane protein [Firmicutes bacterium]|nr:DUF3792 family protein [Alicyclobacillaceae bacterium]MCL6496792.1 TIGR04086 family membrane protein [Bacillota bacterium]
MQVTAILKGALAGLAMGALAAAALALLRWGGHVGGAALASGQWAAKVVSLGTAGAVAGRAAEERLWLHGLLAAATLALVAEVVAQQVGAAAGPLGIELGVAAASGVAGALVQSAW